MLRAEASVDRPDVRIDVAPGAASSEEVASALGNLAAACFKMIPGHGARSVKVGNACIYVLNGMKGDYAARQLARLRWTVKFRSARKLLDKAFAAVASVPD